MRTRTRKPIKMPHKTHSLFMDAQAAIARKDQFVQELAGKHGFDLDNHEHRHSVKLHLMVTSYLTRNTKKYAKYHGDTAAIVRACHN